EALDRFHVARFGFAAQEREIQGSEVEQLDLRSLLRRAAQGVPDGHARCAFRAQAAGQPDDANLDVVVTHDRATPSSWRSSGATRVPISSIDRISFSCGSDAAFIWNVMREMPPSAALCRMIFSATTSGLPIISAPSGPICASKSL